MKTKFAYYRLNMSDFSQRISDDIQAQEKKDQHANNQSSTNTPSYRRRDWKESLGVFTIEDLGPRGPKDKVLKIKSNGPGVRGRGDCQESRRM